MRNAGAAVETQDLPFPLQDFQHLQQELCYWEAARILLLPGRMRIVPQLRSLLGPFLDRDVSTYMAARRRRRIYQQQFEASADHAIGDTEANAQTAIRQPVEGLWGLS